MSDKAMTKIEEVARSIYEATPFKETAGGFDEQSDVYRRMCMVLARAAIEAMREPTEAMMSAVGQTTLQAKIWQAMIDAALSEGEERG